MAEVGLSLNLDMVGHHLASSSWQLQHRNSSERPPNAPTLDHWCSNGTILPIPKPATLRCGRLKFLTSYLSRREIHTYYGICSHHTSREAVYYW